MPSPNPIEIELSELEKVELKKLVTRHNVGQQIAVRGRIVLETQTDKANSQIAREQGVSLDMVRLWRQRWVDLQPISLADLSVEERLADLPRSGAPGRISADQRCQIEALACEQPAEAERPISHWTGREIADEVMKRGIVEQISARHAGRLLKRRGFETTSNPLLADQ